MTEKLEIIRTYDIIGDAAQGTISLLNFTDGFNVAYDGWTPSFIQESDGSIIETMRARAKGTSTDDLMLQIRQLDRCAIKAQRYYETNAEPYATMFRVQIEGESNPRQSLIYAIEHEPASSFFNVSTRSIYQLNEYKIAITRAPWWEGIAAGTVDGGTIPTWGGGYFDYNAISGDMPARVAHLYFGTAPATGTPTYSTRPFPDAQFWLGFRTNQFGSSSAWPGTAIPLYVGTAVYSAIQGTTDPLGLTYAGTAGTVAYASFGTANFRNVTSLIKLSAITPNYSQMAGRFLVLARAKVNRVDGTLGQYAYYDTLGVWQYNIRMAVCHNTSDALSLGTAAHVIARSDVKLYPPVPLQMGNGVANYWDYPGAVWHLYEMGEVEFPPARAGSVNFDDFGLAFITEEVNNPGGTANVPRVLWDSIYLVPTGEGYIAGGRTLNHPGVDSLSSTNTHFMGYVSPDEQTSAHMEYQGTAAALGTANYTTDKYIHYKGLPYEGGRAIFVWDYTHHVDYSFGTSIRNWNVHPVIRYYPRWANVRGALETF